MPSFTFCKAVQWARLDSLMGHFWTPGLMSDTPASEGEQAEFSFWLQSLNVKPVNIVLSLKLASRNQSHLPPVLSLGMHYT